jgi:hypothetical protein
MKKLIMLLLLLGGTVLTTYAQGRHNGWGNGNNKHHKQDRYCDDRYEGRRYEKHNRGRDWDDCRRPRKVVYVRPYPVYRPRPVYPVYYAPSRPGVVFNAGVTIVR